MYITVNFVSKNVFKSKKNVRNVRKWPNLCSIRPRNVLKLVEKFRLSAEF
jgi:hypothetical protein